MGIERSQLGEDTNISIHIVGLIVDVAALKKSRKIILDSVDFKVQKGKMLAIIGPNGAGKSSLLKVILNLVPFHAEISLIEGQHLPTLNAKRRAHFFSYVPQSIDMVGDISVYEWCKMARFKDQFFGFGLSSKDHQAIDHALEMCDLIAFKHAPLHHLSGGERQRALIAGALAQQAKVMLLDEPTNHLDPAHALDILKLLRRLNQECQQTIVCVSHDVNQVYQYFDDVYALKKGCCLFQGLVSEQIHAKALTLLYDQRFIEIKTRQHIEHKISNTENSELSVYFPFNGHL